MIQLQPVLREWSGTTLRDRIDLIWQQIYKSIRDPITRILMAHFIRECPERDDMCDLEAIFNGYKSHFRYTPDIRDLDSFLSLRRQLALGGNVPTSSDDDDFTAMGDCDDATIALVSLCYHAGFKAGAKVIGPRKEFVHIYPWAEVPRTPRRGVAPQKVYMDATIRTSALGWEPPQRFRGVERVFVYAEKH